MKVSPCSLVEPCGLCPHKHQLQVQVRRPFVVSGLFVLLFPLFSFHLLPAATWNRNCPKKLIGCPLPPPEAIATSCCLRAQGHPRWPIALPLPPVWPAGQQLRPIRSHTTRLTNSLLPWAIQTVNKHYPPTAHPCPPTSPEPWSQKPSSLRLLTHGLYLDQVLSPDFFKHFTAMLF